MLCICYFRSGRCTKTPYTLTFMLDRGKLFKIHVKNGCGKNPSTIGKFPKMCAPDTHPPHHTFPGFSPDPPLTEVTLSFLYISPLCHQHLGNFVIQLGGGQEKILGTYGGVGGCPEHTFWDFFLPILGFFLKEKRYFLNNFKHFFAFLYQTLHFFAKREPN